MNRICVYCGSNVGARRDYAAAARNLGIELAHRNIGLVYGGAHVGIMGILADAVLEAGGEVTGVMPRALVDREVAHTGLTDLIVTDSMHERKTAMAQHADAFIALPGGIGTLEEIFEIWTWGHLGMHTKPCGLLDVAGYYHHLLEFLDHAAAEGFIRAEPMAMLLVETSPAALLDRFATYRAPGVKQWIDAAQT